MTPSKRAMRAEEMYKDGPLIIPDEIRLFIKDITLFLQQHSNYKPEKIEPMFQRAYKLYSKYEVETKQQRNEQYARLCPHGNAANGLCYKCGR